VAGAFLCVPILVISMIIFSHFESTRWLAILLSQNGNLARPQQALAEQGAGRQLVRK